MASRLIMSSVCMDARLVSLQVFAKGLSGSTTSLATVSRCSSTPAVFQFSRSMASRVQIERSRIKGNRVRLAPSRGDLYSPQQGTNVFYNNESILTPSDPISYILEQPALVIERQIEFMNIFLVSLLLWVFLETAR